MNEMLVYCEKPEQTMDAFGRGPWPWRSKRGEDPRSQPGSTGSAQPQSRCTARAMSERSLISKGLSGVAGEYFVAGELSRRGYIASITLRNTRGVDILVAGRDAARSAGIQVKTNQGSGKSWLLNKKAESMEENSLFYVFVNLNGPDGVPSFHVVPSAVEAEYLRRTHSEWLATPGRQGQERKDTSMRKFEDRDDDWKDRWDVLDLEGAV